MEDRGALRPLFSLHRCTHVTRYRQHDGALPATYAEKKAFKQHISTLKRKIDEENFEEAEAQAFRLWSEKSVSHPSTHLEL